MGIRPMEMSGIISRTQDMATLKHNEDNKGMVDQTNFQNQFKKEIDQHLRQVRNADDANENEYKYDAKEKGNGQYSEQEKKKKEKDKKTDKVVVKSVNKFDIRI